MTNRDAELEKLFKFTYEFSNMETVFIGPLNEVRWESVNCQIPRSLKPYIHNLRKKLALHQSNSESNIMFHATPFKINFISVNFYDKSKCLGSFIVGPFLLDELTSSELNETMLEYNLPISLLPILEQYYLSLPLISAEKSTHIAEFLSFLASYFHSGHRQDMSSGITYNIQNEYVELPETIKQKTDEAIEQIEERYHTENKLLAIIEAGKIEKLNVILEELTVFNKLPDRVPNNPLRSRKNFAFVTNTLLRKSAERGGVHPIYIDSISEKFAIQIEKTTSLQQLSDLHDKMLFEYCDTVRKLSLKNYSTVIRKAIEYIRLHLDQNLRLEGIAGAIHISPYELSRQFKKETGEPLTAYINRLRIQEAVQIMRSENISITDTAQMVGFNDVNYFTKVFKQIKGCTPSQYRKRKSNK